MKQERALQREVARPQEKGVLKEPLLKEVKGSLREARTREVTEAPEFPSLERTRNELEHALIRTG